MQSPPPPSGRPKPASPLPARRRLSFRVTAVQTARAARAPSRGGCSGGGSAPGGGGEARSRRAGSPPSRLLQALGKSTG